LSTEVRSSLFLRSAAGVSFSAASASAKASSVGAKTVAWSAGSERTSFRPAASIAATRVESLAATAVS
jgi:hypothetical protein